MKTRIVLPVVISGLCLAPGILRADFILQRYSADTTVPAVIVPNIASEGTATSGLPMLEDNNLVFSLYAEKDGAEPIFLDEKVVFAGSGDVKVITEDRFPGEARVLGDRSFYASGLVTVPEGASTLGTLVLRRENTSDPSNPITISEETLTANSKDADFYTTALDVAALEAAGKRGQETFSIYSVDSSGNAVLVDRQSVNIYPPASVEITGLKTGDVIVHSSPTVEFTFKNLYPVSETWARIYKGNYDPNNENGTFIVPVSVTYPPAEDLNWLTRSVPDPQTAKITLEDWSELIPDDGIYTIEVLTQTPFNGWTPVMLSHTTIEVDRTIEVQGQIFSSE